MLRPHGRKNCKCRNDFLPSLILGSIWYMYLGVSVRKFSNSRFPSYFMHDRVIKKMWICFEIESLTLFMTNRYVFSIFDYVLCMKFRYQCHKAKWKEFTCKKLVWIWSLTILIFSMWNMGSAVKGLINLVLMDSDLWNKTAHVNSYIVDTPPKCTEYVPFPKRWLFFCFDQMLFEKFLRVCQR